ncbi:MAG: hypothetical protein C4344_06565 [Acidimicrobiia bacterium]
MLLLHFRSVRDCNTRTNTEREMLPSQILQLERHSDMPVAADLDRHVLCHTKLRGAPPPGWPVSRDATTGPSPFEADKQRRKRTSDVRHRDPAVGQRRRRQAPVERHGRTDLTESHIHEAPLALVTDEVRAPIVMGRWLGIGKYSVQIGFAHEDAGPLKCPLGERRALQISDHQLRSPEQ